MSLPANNLRIHDEDEWIPELREELDPTELQSEDDAPDPDITEPGGTRTAAPTQTAVPARTAAPARTVEPARPVEPPAPHGAAARRPGLERQRLDAIAAYIEQELQRKLNATMTIVRIKLMQELRAQLLELYQEYGDRRGRGK